MVVYAAENINSRTQAHDLLARAAREIWGWESLPPTERTRWGKPFFPAFPDHHFNLSHSAALALCALSNSPVGADIQIVKDSWREGLPRRVCSPKEMEWLEGQQDRWEAFTLLWALKEARGKYDGTGLSAGVQRISVPLPHPSETLYHHDGLWFRIYRGERWTAAVCGEETPPEKLIWV